MTLKEKLAKEHPECINSKNPGGCDGCPKEYGYSNVCLRTHKGCADIYKDICAACWDQEYIESEERTRITLKEKLMMEHPECVNDRYIGGCKGCPSKYGYSDDDVENCGNDSMNIIKYNDKCIACWNQEYKESETKSEENPYTKIASNMRLALDTFNALGFTRYESLEVIKAMIIHNGGEIINNETR